MEDIETMITSWLPNTCPVCYEGLIKSIINGQLVFRCDVCYFFVIQFPTKEQSDRMFSDRKWLEQIMLMKRVYEARNQMHVLRDKILERFKNTFFTLFPGMKDE